MTKVDTTADLAREVGQLRADAAQLRADFERLRADLADEVVTRRLSVVDHEGYVRVEAFTGQAFGCVAVRGKPENAESSVMMYANEESVEPGFGIEVWVGGCPAVGMGGRGIANPADEDDCVPGYEALPPEGWSFTYDLEPDPKPGRPQLVKYPSDR